MFLKKKNKKEVFKKIPEELKVKIILALVRATGGMVYPEVRQIVVRLNNKKELLFTYYLDREVTDFDEEVVFMVNSEIDGVDGDKDITSSKGRVIYISDEEYCSNQVRLDYVKKYGDEHSGRIYLRMEEGEKKYYK